MKQIFLLISLVLFFSAIVYPAEKAIKAAENIVLTNGLVIKKDTTYYLYPNKAYSRFIVAENYVLPTSMVVKADTEICFYENKNLKSFVIADDYLLDTNGNIIKADTTVRFYENMNFQSYTCSKDWLDPDTGMTIKGGAELSFYDNGAVLKYTIAKPFTDKQKITYLENTEVIWDSIGNIRALTLGKDWKNFKKGQQIYFQKNGQPKIYDPAKDLIE